MTEFIFNLCFESACEPKTDHYTAGAASQCYEDELMLLKCQINTNTKKLDFCILQKGIEILILVSIIFNY